MIKQVEASVIYALNSMRDGTFSGRTISFGLQDNGVGFSTTNSALGQNAVNRANALRQEIISGQRTVRATLAEARLLPGFPNLVQAIDG
jgi:basic membrane lipoprotein Med (substrate-binding protein (PBP1-ABC) superfamily)